MINVRHVSFVAVSALLVGVLCLPACSILAPDDDPATPAVPSCTNGTRDEGEQGPDCGGTCTAKCTGAECTANEECGSGKCDAKACTAPAGKPCGVGTAVLVCEDNQPCELDKDCKSAFCSVGVCKVPPAESHTDGIINGGETDIDCGGSVKATKPCVDGQKCFDSADCVGTCTGGICGPIGPTDGKKNQDETDIDCGGPNAPKCDDGKTCAGDGDCMTGYCPPGTLLCTAPTYTDGVQNGTETDLDCGGTGAGMKKCPETKKCLVDGDCFGACSYKKLCVDQPSCKNQNGADTCGYGEIGINAPTHLGPGGTILAGHESCCRNLEVVNYTDPVMPAGKTKVFVDKYEITAGRMRAFLEAIGGGVDALGNAKAPNVKAYITANPPSRWNPGWTNVLPADNTASTAGYAVKFASVGSEKLYPGQDDYVANHPTQGTWWIRGTGPTDTARQIAGQQGSYQVQTGLFFQLTTTTMFPEYYANPAVWTGPGEGEGYAVNHALNCSNAPGAYGWSTYWFDDATNTTYNGGRKAFPKATLDQKSMTCAPNALFAAFCAWDGGQLVTAEVMDNISGNTVSPIYDNGACSGGCQTGKMAVGRSMCNANTLNTFPDGGQGCYNVYYYPGTPNNYDDSSKIAPGGRVLGDVMSKTAADEPWMDMIGNLQEVVLKNGETVRFDYRGYGVEWSSITHHHNQQTTPRNKAGSFGARCMRFK